MRDRDDRAGIVLEEALEPGDRLGVEMVGRLVEQQQVRRLQQQPAQRDAAPLAARQRRDVGVRRRQPQRVHRQLEPRVEVPAVRRLDPVLDLALLLEDLVHLLGRQLLAELRVDLVVAREQRARSRRRPPRRCRARSSRDRAAAPAAGSRRWCPRPGTPRRGTCWSSPAMIRSSVLLPDAVQAEHADLRARQEREPDVLEDDVVGRMDLPEPLHGVDELWHAMR